MPIRLNLLAEAQAAEELRRRDPVKRAIVFGTLLVALMLAWSSSLQLKAMLVKKDLGRVEAQINSQTNTYQRVLESEKESAEIKRKLAALHQLTTNRFLNGTMLNALQQAAIEEVHLTRLKVLQEYAVTAETKPRTNAGRIVPGKPAFSTEKTVLTLEAKDTSSSPGDKVNAFKEAVARNDYFQSALGRTNDVRVVKWDQLQSPPDGRPFIPFILECRYPEKIR